MLYVTTSSLFSIYSLLLRLGNVWEIVYGKLEKGSLAFPSPFLSHVAMVDWKTIITTFFRPYHHCWSLFSHPWNLDWPNDLFCRGNCNSFMWTETCTLDLTLLLLSKRCNHRHVNTLGLACWTAEICGIMTPIASCSQALNAGTASWLAADCKGMSSWSWD